MKTMFSFCTDDDNVKRYATKIITKRNDNHVKVLIEKDNELNQEVERDLELKLKKWRLKERKHDFKEKIE
jgi:hypothetical protein